MRKAAFLILALSIAFTVISALIWFVGLIGGFGGSLIHLFLLLTPLGVIGVIVGVVLLVVSRRGARG